MLLVRALLIALLLVASPLAAAEFDDGVSALNTSRAEEQVAAIENLVNLADPRALPVLQALSDGKLFVRKADKTLVIAERDGDNFKITLAATQEAGDALEEDDIELIVLEDDAKEPLAKALTALAASGGATASNVPEFDRLVAALNADSFSDKIAAIEKLAALGDARAAPILQAMTDGRLYAKGSAIVIGAGNSGTIALTDALTGTAAGSAAVGELQQITVNNRLRGVLAEALGRLGLFSTDAAQRRRATTALLSGASAESAPLLREAIAKESDASLRALMQTALAAAEIADPDKAKRLAAIAMLATSSDLNIRGLLQRQSTVDSDADVRQAAAAALKSVEGRLVWIDFIAAIFQGLSLGSVLLLAAIGLAITFGVMGVINMAHGEMIMIGAYTTFVVQQILLAVAPGLMEISILLAIPAAFLVAGALGVALERGVIRFLYGRPLETLLMTWGLSMILQQAVRSLFGPTNRVVTSPSWMTGAIDVMGVSLTQNRIWIIVFGLMVLFVVIAVMRYTPFGLQMRAVTQNRAMASAMGIRTNYIDALTFGLGSGIAGIAGVALSQIDNVSPNLGQSYIVDCFMVVVFGGVGNLYGTLVGAGLLGIVNKFLEPYAGAVLGKIFVLVAIILFIQRRPRGLFALKGRAVEA
jgi:urea transport system permease protein